MRRLKELSPRERERAMDVCIRFYTPPIFANEFAAAAGDTKHNTEKIWVFRVQGYIFMFGKVFSKQLQLQLSLAWKVPGTLNYDQNNYV